MDWRQLDLVVAFVAGLGIALLLTALAQSRKESES